MHRAILKNACFLALAVALAGPGLLLGKPVEQPKVTIAELEANKSVGSRQAPITMEIFADFECPQCRLFYLTTTKQIIDNYVNTGKVYFIHRDFPLSMHPYSHVAAQWANAAAAAGPRVFQEAEAALYTKQDEWGATGNVEATLAAALPAADMKKVREFATSDAAVIEASIAKDQALGQSRRVSGTPTIFITHAGQTTPLPPGGVSYDLLKQYFDYLLKH